MSRPSGGSWRSAAAARRTAARAPLPARQSAWRSRWCRPRSRVGTTASSAADTRVRVRAWYAHESEGQPCGGRYCDLFATRIDEVESYSRGAYVRLRLQCDHRSRGARPGPMRRQHGVGDLPLARQKAEMRQMRAAGLPTDAPGCRTVAIPGRGRSLTESLALAAARRSIQ